MKKIMALIVALLFTFAIASISIAETGGYGAAPAEKKMEGKKAAAEEKKAPEKKAPKAKAPKAPKAPKKEKAAAEKPAEKPAAKPAEKPKTGGY